MKICQLSAVDFTMYHFLIPLMKGMQGAGHNVVGVCAPGSLNDKIRNQGFRLENIEFDRSYNLLNHTRAYRQLVKLFRKEQFDIVHVHTPIAALIGRLAAARAGIPTKVYTAHGFYFHERQPLWLRSAFIMLEWIGGRFTDVLFTQAEEDAEAGRRFHLCRGSVIQAIGNGVDPEQFYGHDNEQNRKNLQTEFDTPMDATIILMVGRLVAEKGYIELLKAMEHVDAHLWIIGSRLKSDHASSIDRAVEGIKQNADLSSRIHFLGYRDDVANLMGAVDIFTLPSHREGMPRSIIEAMMSGLPVVATNIRGSREEVIEGETGYLVPVNNPQELAEALNILVNNKDTRYKMGIAGKARALALYDENKVVARQITALNL